MTRKIVASRCSRCKTEYKEKHLYCPQCGNKTETILEPLGRAPTKNEVLLRENILDEKYDFHHIRKKVITINYGYEKIKKLVHNDNENEIIAIPRDVHGSLKEYGNNAPSDFKKFSHQFFMMQIIVQLYNGFDEIFDLFIEHDEFLSYDDYLWWKDKEE